MDLELRSETWKRVFDDTKVELNENEEFSLHLYDDENVSTITSDLEIDNIYADYINIRNKVKGLNELTCNNIPQNIVETLIAIESPKSLGIYGSDINLEGFSRVREEGFKNIEELKLIALKSEDGQKHDFPRAAMLKNLKKLTVLNCENINFDNLFENIPNPEQIEELSISFDLPSPDIISKFSNIKKLSIAGIKDSKKLIEFLDKLPCDKIEKLGIVASDLKDFPAEIIERFTSLKNIDFAANSSIDYNKWLEKLPNKNEMEGITFSALVGMNPAQISPSIISQYENLKLLYLDRFAINDAELNRYLKGADQLLGLTIHNSDIKNFNFINGVRPDLGIIIKQEEFDFTKFTPEIARNHDDINVYDDSSFVSTQKGENGYDLSFSANNEELYNLRNLIEKSGLIKNSAIRLLMNSNSLNQIKNYYLPYAQKCAGDSSLVLESTSFLSVEELNELNADRENINQIVVADSSNGDRNIIKRYTYDVDEYKKVKEEISKITDRIPYDLENSKKLAIICQRLGEKMVYDNGIVGPNKYSKYAKDNVDKSRNMINGLFENTCVCAGYADILYNCASEVGIPMYKIDGIGGGEYHQWNKARIDGQIYNVDLTWIADSLRSGNYNNLQYFLVSDNEFEKSHEIKAGNKEKCDKDFDPIQIQKDFKYAKEFEKNSLWFRLKNSIKSFIKNRREAADIPKLQQPNPNIIQPEFSKPSWELSSTQKAEINKALNEPKDNSQEINIDEKSKSEDDGR